MKMTRRQVNESPFGFKYEEDKENSEETKDKSHISLKCQRWCLNWPLRKKERKTESTA